MKELLEKLIQNLEREIALYADALKTLKEKQRCLVENDVDGLECAVAAEREFVLEAGQLDRTRRAIVHKLSEQCDGKADEMCAGEIAKAVSDETAELLDAGREKLLGVAQQVRDINRINGLLAKSALEFAGEVLGALLPGALSTYDSCGVSSARRDMSAFLRAKA